MTQPASEGALARFCTTPGSSPYTWDSSAQPWEFYSEDLLKLDTLVNPNTIRGTRSPCAARTRLGPHRVFGPIHMPVSPATLAIWAERFLGAARSTNTFALAESLPAFGCLFDRIGNTFEYTNNYVDRVIIRGQQFESGGQITVDMTLDIIGTDENTGVSYPAVTLDCSSIAKQAFIFSDLAVTLNSSARKIFNFMLMIDNHLDPRYANSLSPTSIRPMDRTVRLRTTNPFTSDESDLYQMAVAGAAGSLVMTNSTVSATFNFDRLQCTTKSPVVAGKMEIPLYLDFISRKASVDEVQLVLDDTP